MSKKYYRSAEAIFDDTWVGRWMTDFFNFLASLWTGQEVSSAPRPPLWVRRAMVILFPVSYFLLAATFFVAGVLALCIAIPAISVIGIANFYRRRWE